MSLKWNPREVLSVDPQAEAPLTCVGIDKFNPGNRRCQNATGRHKRLQASGIFDAMSRMPLSGRGYDEGALKEKNREALGELLCWRHREGPNWTQFGEVEKQWWEKIRGAQAQARQVERGYEHAPLEGQAHAQFDQLQVGIPIRPGVAEQGRNPPFFPPRPVNPIRAIVPEQAPPAVQIPQPRLVNLNQIMDRIKFLEGRRDRDEAELRVIENGLQKRARDVENQVRELERRRTEINRGEEVARQEEERNQREWEELMAEEQRQHEAARVREETRRREAADAATRMDELRRQDEERRLRARREQFLRAQEEARLRQEMERGQADERRQEEQRPPQPQPRNPEIIAAPAPAPAAQQIVLRKPLGECYACYESITRPEGAQWCRAQCGQNICNECFEHWRANQRQDRVRCGFWYVFI
ncbi:hypothetical protein NHQ30_006176 [Ciborinia camelliae]|nr:hypothetical protein NHQ30_006176 [Ciborinia camelliae]